jgi:hypothetical protein
VVGRSQGDHRFLKLKVWFNGEFIVKLET